MEKLEVNKLIEKIIVFRQSFLKTKNTLDEWFKILEPYDYSDVDKKLDEYFRESNNFGQYPDPYYLSRNLTTKNEKEKYRNVSVRCQICGEEISHSEYDSHFEKCSSIEYVCDMSKKFFGKELNKQELRKLPNEKFDKAYWNFCEKLNNQMKTGLEKHILENAILTHKGIKPQLNVEEVSNFTYNTNTRLIEG